MCVFTQLDSPDDNGSCATLTSESSCLSQKSIFDSSVYNCQWGAASDDSTLESCMYLSPQFTFLVR